MERLDGVSASTRIENWRVFVDDAVTLSKIKRAEGLTLKRCLDSV